MAVSASRVMNVNGGSTMEQLEAIWRISIVNDETNGVIDAIDHRIHGDTGRMDEERFLNSPLKMVMNFLRCWERSIGKDRHVCWLHFRSTSAGRRWSGSGYIPTDPPIFAGFSRSRSPGTMAPSLARPSEPRRRR